MSRPVIRRVPRARRHVHAGIPATDVQFDPELGGGVGFLRLSRRGLAVTAAVLSLCTIVVHELPASAAVVVEEPVMELAAQSLEVDAITAAPVITRDVASVTQFDLVQWPLDPGTAMAAGFGYRTAPCRGCSSDHEGIDWNPGYGTPVASIAEGVVVDTGNPQGALGVFAVIEHVVDGVAVQSVYGHMARGSLAVRVGDTVARGQIIGLVGSTGASTGAHLHFGIKTASGTFINPIPWLSAHVTQPWGQ